MKTLNGCVACKWIGCGTNGSLSEVENKAHTNFRMPCIIREYNNCARKINAEIA